MEKTQQDKFFEVYTQTITSLENCQPLLNNVDEALKQRSSAVRKRVSDHCNGNPPFRVAFCGIFSAGKSSLINTLLQCKYKLPTGVSPITKKVTRIKYGQKLSGSYYHDGSWEKLDEQQTLKIINGEVGLPASCNEITLELPADLLKGNIEFLDTPGFDDEMGDELEYISREAAADADMVVLCYNALQIGKIMDRKLLVEMESTIGNFCMAVMCMDCLNTEKEKEDIKRKAEWSMQGRGNLAMLPESFGRYFLVSCKGQDAVLDGFDTYLKSILDNTEKKRAIQNATDLLGMISVVTDLSVLSDATAHEIDLSSIHGELPQQDLQEEFVNGMNKMMETAGSYCPQCGRTMEKEQTVCYVCGRVHQIKVRTMNQETRDKLQQISHLLSWDNTDYSICWNLEARKIAKVIDQTEELAEAVNMPGITKTLQGDLHNLLLDCRSAEFQIAIVGVMNAGKSMLMNALMGTEIASVDINPETASLTKFRSADHFYIKIFFHDQEEWDKLNESARKSASSELSKKLSTPEVKDLSKKWLGHAPVEKSCHTKQELQKLVAHWTSARSNDHLFAAEVEVGIDRGIFDMPDEVVFVDTPGLHDPVQYRSEITKTYIKRANAVLIAVPTKALTAEGLGTITDVLDHIGSNKEKAYIVATQKDINSKKDCDKVITEWVTHLTDIKRYQDEKEAREHIIVTSGKMYLLAETLINLDEKILAAEMEILDSGEYEASDHFELADIEDLEAYVKKILGRRRYDVLLLRENPEDVKKVFIDSGIPALRDCLSTKLLSKYKQLKKEGIRDNYIRCRKELAEIAENVKKKNMKMLSSARSGADELRKELDEARKEVENEKVKSQEIREMAEMAYRKNLDLIRHLFKEG